jgi:hypothetical protein
MTKSGARNCRGRSPQAALASLVIQFAITVGGCAPLNPNPVLNHNAGKTVRYEVSGDSGAANNVTYMINNGQQQDIKVALPWSKEFTIGQGFQPLVVNAQNAGAGSINCRILVDGRVISDHTSNGQYAVVMCSGS